MKGQELCENPKQVKKEHKADLSIIEEEKESSKKESSQFEEGSLAQGNKIEEMYNVKSSLDDQRSIHLDPISSINKADC